jgi:eukaryotic-like serine/threonine-protein kinase
MHDVSVGTTIGSYIIDALLHSGGMSTSYRAHTASEQQVILKFPLDTMLGDPAYFERFQREVAIGKQLHHPYIQHLLAVEEYEGTPYLVMQYIAGTSLRARLDTQSPLPVAEALPLLDKLCQGVAYCHEQGVVHRDLKPENIIVTPDGDPVIIDFGIALRKRARRMTWPGLSTAVGTPDYIAPEQIQGKRGDARTDIYALGVIAYECLTGQPPFHGDNPLTVMHQHLSDSVPPLTARLPSLPTTLDVVVRKALERQPDDRFPTVETFRHALLNHATIGSTIIVHSSARGVPRWRRWLARA